MRALALLLLCSVGPFDCGTRSAAPTPTPAPGAAAPAAVRFDTPRGTWVVQAEVAKTDEERQRGLMFRRELPKDTGMLFLFSESDKHSFWMRNTYLSLDMIFIGEDRTVVGVVSAAQPRTDTPRGVDAPSRYVLEVLAGEAYAHAVGPGVRATFINVPE
jgi:uncharacterized membrane protein (UPF0127 family)